MSGASARATAGVADFGMMSMILGAVASKSPVPVPELPAPITADDRDHPDVERNPLATPPEAPALAWEEAHASKAPASRSRVRGPELGVPGLLTFTGGESAASADGGVSSSTVTLGRLVLGGAGGAPEIVLSDLVWAARQEMGRPGTASFAVGSVTVAGQALPIPAGVVSAEVLQTVNDALTPVGLRLEVPVSAADAAGANVSSLVIQVRNTETVAALLGEATKPAVPVLNSMLDTLLAAAPDASASRLVVNALLATGTTRGGGRLELGGATARIGNVEVADLPAPSLPPTEVEEAPAFTPPLTAEPSTPVPAPVATDDPGYGYGDSGSSYSGGPGASPESLGSLPTPTDPSETAAAPDTGTVAARPVATTVPGGTSAPLVLGAALLAIAMLAVGDKLRLRRLVGGGGG